MKEILSSFKFESEKLTGHIKVFLESNPKSRVLMIGLSLGANFVGETMKKIGANSSVLAIMAGSPFWERALEMENILELTNGKDILVTGDYKALITAVAKGLIKWAAAKISGRKLSFAGAIHFSGHKYDWRSAKLRGRITSFLESNFKIY